MSENTNINSFLHAPNQTDHSQLRQPWFTPLNNSQPIALIPRTSNNLNLSQTQPQASIPPSDFSSYSHLTTLQNACYSVLPDNTARTPGNMQNSIQSSNDLLARQYVEQAQINSLPINLTVTNAFVQSAPASLPNSEPLTNNCILVDSDQHSLLLPASNQTVQNQINADGTSNDRSNDRRSNYVYNILNQTSEGQFQIAAYDFERVDSNKKKLLETKKQLYFNKNKVAKLVIGHEFFRTNSFAINSQRFRELARSCAELFPTCLPTGFYTPKTDNKCAGGILYNFYKKQREKEVAIGRISEAACRKRKHIEDDVEESNEFKDLQETRVAIIDEKYIEKWRKSAYYERTEFFKSTSDINLIFKKLPVLSNPLGYQLIQSDFTARFKKSQNLFTENLSKIADKVIAHGKTKKSKVDQPIKDLLKENVVITGLEHKQTLALMLLPHLFRRFSKLTARSKGKSWNPERSEIVKSFIYHVKVSDDVNESLNEIQAELLELHNNHLIIVQPYVVIFGPSLADISSAFVVLGSNRYQFASVSLAVDICFQSMKVFNQKYSVITNHIWQFLEHQIYELEVVDMYSVVTNVLEKL